MDSSSNNGEFTPKQKFLRLAQDRFKLAAEAEATYRSESLDDFEFSIGNQWPQDIQAQRQLDGRPCLTMNRLPQFIRQVTNEQRQQRPAIQINPIGNGADTDTAEIEQGICRHIEVNSDGEVAYDTGFDHMVRGGFGHWRILNQATVESGGKEEIFIRPIYNPFCVYTDPSAVDPTRSDAKWRFIVQDMRVDEFKEKYGESALAKGSATIQQYSSVGDAPFSWATTGQGETTIRVAEYFYIEGTEEKPEVKWALITGIDVLEGGPGAEKKLPGTYIPIVTVAGDDLIVNGKRHISGLVRHAKDPQRAYNYWNSAATEMIALAPKAPFIGAKGSFKSNQRQWEQANYRMFSYLEHDIVGMPGGQAAPAPQRNSVEPPIQAMRQMLEIATADMQATTGLYPNNLGQQQSAGESGRAVLARQREGDVNTLNYADNLARSIRQTGRILLQWIPAIYREPRVQRIIKPDDSVSHVGIFHGDEDKEDEARAALMQIDPAVSKVYDISVGLYDVSVSVGPSYQSKRQEAVATQLQLIQSEPQLLNIIGDLVVGNMDIPQAKEIAKRLKAILPPQVAAVDGDANSQMSALQAQNSQLQQQLAQLVPAYQQAQLDLQTKRVETEGKMSIEKMKIDAQIAIAEINTKAQVAGERAQMFHDVWLELHGSAADAGLQAQQQAHEQSLAQQQQQAAAQQQGSQQAHEVGMGAMNAAQQAQESSATPNSNQ